MAASLPVVLLSIVLRLIRAHLIAHRYQLLMSSALKH